jgi:hypothetical protein
VILAAGEDLPSPNFPELARRVVVRAAEEVPTMSTHEPADAIEVVALFEDAIVDTRHFTNPRSGRVSRATTGLLAGGAAALSFALLLFLTSFVEVAAAKHAGVAIARGGVGMDVLVVLLLCGGLSALVLGLSRRFEERAPRDYTIGPDPKALVPLAAGSLTANLFPLVRSTGERWELTFTDGMKGEAMVGGKWLPLGELPAQPSLAVAGARALPLGGETSARVEIGGASFVVRPVPAPRRYPVPLSLDRRALLCIGATSAACLLALGLIFSLPPDARALSIDRLTNPERIAKIIVKPPDEAEEKLPSWLTPKKPVERGDGGKAHAGPSGKMGDEKSRRDKGRFALKGPKDNVDLHLARQQAIDAAQKAGVLGILRGSEGSKIFSQFGQDTALGHDAETVMGGLLGDQVADAYGCPGCLGVFGHEKGGGGTGMGTIGLSRIGTLGTGFERGPGHGTPHTRLDPRKPHEIDKMMGNVIVKGGIDKELIRRVCRMHRNEVKYCYDKELAKHPELFGRVTVQFTIAGLGKVVGANVSQSTMHNEAVEQCIAGAVRRWDFPRPEGGGLVMVSYPFMLQSAGGE